MDQSANLNLVRGFKKMTTISFMKTSGLVPIHCGVIHLERTLNFPKSYHFLPPDTHLCVCVSGGKKC